MTEQDQTPGTAGDDTEGHARVAFDATDDDTEGHVKHKFGREAEETDTADDDTEGHVKH